MRTHARVDRKWDRNENNSFPCSAGEPRPRPSHRSLSDRYVLSRPPGDEGVSKDACGATGKSWCVFTASSRHLACRWCGGEVEVSESSVPRSGRPPFCRFPRLAACFLTRRLFPRERRAHRSPSLPLQKVFPVLLTIQRTRSLGFRPAPGLTEGAALAGAAGPADPWWQRPFVCWHISPSRDGRSHRKSMYYHPHFHPLP